MKDRFKLVRTTNGLSQDEFAKKLGISLNNVKDIEIGRVRLSFEVATKVSETFGVSLSWLATGKEEDLQSKHGLSTEESIILNSVLSSPKRRKGLFDLLSN